MLPADAIWTSFVALVAEAPVAAFIKDPDGRYVYANRYLQESQGDRFGFDWFGKTDADLWPPKLVAQIRDGDEATLKAEGWQLFSQPMPVEDEDHTYLVMKFPLAGPDGRMHVGGIGLDQTEQVRVAAERDQLAMVVDQVAESVMIADLEARITYVNPAFERVTGYERHEVMGQNARIISSGEQPAAFYKAMWGALTSGAPWVADLINRRKDGSLFTEEAVISPIRGSSGAITSYVAVKREVTNERTLELRSAKFNRERALIAGTIRGLRAGDTPEATAQTICRQVLNLSGVTAAQLFIFELDGRAMAIGFAITGRPDPPLLRLPQDRSHHLRSRAAQGPWIESWSAQPEDANFGSLTDFGVHLVACAPVRADGILIGLMVIDGERSMDKNEFTESLPALMEFADLASALIGREVAGRTTADRARSQIRSLIDGVAFRPVFQPIVDIFKGTAVGYEALTRFADGVGPDLRFGEASAVGLGRELEAATLMASIAAAKDLPESAWLSVNVSPGLISAHQPLQALLKGSKRRLVLEVTEHAEIPDYDAFRSSLRELGQETELAVDDAGAGFASLRHILELRPAFVKLDRSLIARLESDEARQAMIVGLRHFARSVGCQLIAEGVETEAELKVLQKLDIHLGQGYLLGRPMLSPRS
ncbi:MAG: EAL domain-containing protein [Chloroflexota bacterium]|nr:EAL domain-containing protein [Chloroflexota bacterium]